MAVRPEARGEHQLGLLLGIACSWVLVLLGCASAEADEATAPPYSEQQATEQAAEATSR